MNQQAREREKRTDRGSTARKEAEPGKRRAAAVLLLALILAQLAMIGFRGSQKCGFYIDEFYSMGYAHHFTDATPPFRYIHENEQIVKGETWIPAKDLQSLLTVTRDESLLNVPAGQALRLLVRGRAYMGLLNIAETIFTPGRISKWPGIGLNMIFFALGQLVLYLILRRLGISRALSLAGVMMYGFSGTAVSLAIYVRFYTLVILFVLCMILGHLLIWQEQKLSRRALGAALAVASAILGIRHSELTLILAGAFFLLFCGGLLLIRRFREALLYLAAVVATSVFYVSSRTSLLDMLFHPSNYLGDGWPKGFMVRHLMSCTPADFAARIRNAVHLVRLYLFGHFYVLLVFAVIGLLLLLKPLIAWADAADRDGWTVLSWWKDNKHGEKIPVGKRRCREKEAGFRPGSSGLFVFMIAGMIGVYLSFTALTYLYTFRYHMLYHAAVIIVIFFLADRVARVSGAEGAARAAFVLAAAAACAASLLPGRVEYIYPEDRELIAAMEEYQDTPILLLAKRDADHVVELYECVAYAGAEAEIYPVTKKMRSPDPDAFPDEVLIWQLAGTEPMDHMEELKVYYGLTHVGTTHISDVWLARKTGSGESAPDPADGGENAPDPDPAGSGE